MNAPFCPPTPYPPAPPFPANPAIGQVFGSWVWNGTNWAISPVGPLSINIVWIQVSGLYQPSPGLVYAQVECVGGGGGGGGALGSVPTPPPGGQPGWVTGGGGGSGGTYTRSVFPASLLAGGVQVTLGAGGVGGLGSGVPGLGNSGFGGKGGVTTFGALMVCAGGYGGGSNIMGPIGTGVGGLGLDPALGQGADPGLDPGLVVPPGFAQVDNVAQFSAWGNAGDNGGANYFDPAAGDSGQSIVWGGKGGATYFSGTWASAKQQPASQAGRPGHLNGVGGGGGISAYVTAPADGGMGANGTCVITEYCIPSAGGGAGGGECCGRCGAPWTWGRPSCGCW